MQAPVQARQSPGTQSCLGRSGSAGCKGLPQTIRRWCSGQALRHHSRKVAPCRAAARLDIQAVIPMLRADADKRTPPDLASYLFKERIMYLGMSLVPSVTELMIAELLYLQYEDPDKPIYMYINSVGVVVSMLQAGKGGGKIGYEAEAFAIYDTMMHAKTPVHTLCVGNAFGESAMLLAAGKQGQRAALPSASIMLREPMQRFAQMQASDIDIYRTEIRKIKNSLVKVLSEHTQHTPEEIEKAIKRPQYFNPQEAVDFGIIDKVLDPEEGRAALAQTANLRH